MNHLGVPEDAQYTITAGRELDALIAYHHFGWRWFERPNDEGVTVHRCALYPPKSEDWIRWNFYPSFRQISEWPEPERRFGDWDRAGSPIGYRGNPGLGWLPRYSTEVTPATALMEKLMADGWTVALAPRQFEKYPDDRYKFRAGAGSNLIRRKRFVVSVRTRILCLWQSAVPRLVQKFWRIPQHPKETPHERQNKDRME